MNSTRYISIPLVAFIIGFIATTIGLKLFSDQPIIVTVEGWEHGTAMCHPGSEPGQPKTIKIKNAHSWISPEGIFYVINEKHMEDPQVATLIQEAKRQCR